MIKSIKPWDHEVTGHKIAEMVGNIYENEIKIRDSEIERLQKENAELKAEVERLEGQIDRMEHGW